MWRTREEKGEKKPNKEKREKDDEEEEQRNVKASRKKTTMKINRELKVDGSSKSLEPFDWSNWWLIQLEIENGEKLKKPKRNEKKEAEAEFEQEN